MGHKPRAKAKAKTKIKQPPSTSLWGCQVITCTFVGQWILFRVEALARRRSPSATLRATQQRSETKDQARKVQVITWQPLCCARMAGAPRSPACARYSDRSEGDPQQCPDCEPSNDSLPHARPSSPVDFADRPAETLSANCSDSQVPVRRDGWRCYSDSSLLRRWRTRSM